MSEELNWYVSKKQHGTFLMAGNYCVCRLNDKNPKDLYDSISNSEPKSQKELVPISEEEVEIIESMRK